MNRSLLGGGKGKVCFKEDCKLSVSLAGKTTEGTLREFLN